MASLKSAIERLLKRSEPASAGLIALMVAVYFMFRPIVEFVSWNQVDYADHLRYLKSNMDLAAILRLLSMFPHFLFHLLAYLSFKTFPSATMWDAAARVALAFYLLLALALFWLMVRLLGKPTSYRAGAVYALVTLGLMLVMPVDIFTPRNLYLGYIAMNVYHSPTMVVLKPFAIVLFYCTGRALIKPAQTDSSVTRRRTLWLTVLVSALCVLAKPNYAMALIPALIVVAAYTYGRHRFVDWARLAAVVVPAMFILFYQAVLFRNTQGIIIAPLAVTNSWAIINPTAPNQLLPKFLLSILFPLTVYLGYFRQAARSIFLNLAWISFGFGAAYFYLLAENGDRLDDGNFTWSAQIALLVLFVMSTLFFIEHVRLRKFSPITFLCGLTWGLHLVSGIYWYHIHVVASWMGDIISNQW